MSLPIRIRERLHQLQMGEPEFIARCEQMNATALHHKGVSLRSWHYRLRSMCEILQCSADYLLEITDTPTRYNPDSERATHITGIVDRAVELETQNRALKARVDELETRLKEAQADVKVRYLSVGEANQLANEHLDLMMSPQDGLGNAHSLKIVGCHDFARAVVVQSLTKEKS